MSIGTSGARASAAPPAPGGLTPPRAFALRFFAYLVGASVLAWAVTLPERLGAVQRALAGAATWLAGVTGSRATVQADEISVGALLVHINFECTGVYVLLILFVFLLAYPASWRSRLLGAAIGLVALQLLNVLRIAVLVRVAELRPALFDYMHEYVWQGLFLVLTVAYAMTWVERSR